MPLTLQQKLDLRTHIQANTTVLAFSGGNATIADMYAALTQANIGDAQIIADWYSSPTDPAYQVYRSSVPMSQIMLNGFDWTRVDNLGVGKARIWEWMTEANPSRAIDPRKPNIRAGINAVWVGTAPDLAVRAAVYAHCHRTANRAEQVFSVGAGTAPAADGSGPGVATFEGTLTANDILDIHGLPA